MFSFGLLHFISAPVGLELVAGSFTVVSVFESPFNLFNPSSTLILIDRLFNFCINHHLPTTYEKKKHHHPVIDNIVNMCT